MGGEQTALSGSSNIERGGDLEVADDTRSVGMKCSCCRRSIPEMRCGVYDSIYERLAKAEAVSSRLDMVLEIVAANEKERLQHAHSLRMLQQSNTQFAEQLQQMTTGFVQAMAKLGSAFDAASAVAAGESKDTQGLRSPVDVGTERLLAIKEAVLYHYRIVRSSIDIMLSSMFDSVSCATDGVDVLAVNQWRVLQ